MHIRRGETIKGTSMFLCGLLLIYCQMASVGAQDIYVAEVMIEGNATMDVSSFVADMIMAISPTVNIIGAEIIGECELVGDETTCWCSPNYIWSDLVCDTVPACTNSYQCVANVSDLTPMCVPQVNVTVSGSLVMSAATDLTADMQTEFSKLNGFVSLTVTNFITGQNYVVKLNATCRSVKLQDIITKMTADNAVILTMNATTAGLVSMEIPVGRVCYNSQYQLNCTTDETMETCSWLLAKPPLYPLKLGKGTEVLHLPCSNHTAVQLLNIRGSWAGTYTCLLTNGTVSHSATGILEIALLPDEINVTSTPPTANCSAGASTTVTVTCSIYTSSESYTVLINNLPPTKLVTAPYDKYTITMTIDCLTTNIPEVNATCQITNSLSQVIHANGTIPIVYPGNPYCPEDTIWPGTKGGEVATVPICELGRVGYMERKCEGCTWAEPINFCTKEPLSDSLNVAIDFEKGIGATGDIAMALFDNMRTCTACCNSYGDITNSISILSVMGRASSMVSLPESLIPNLMESAGGLLNTSWLSGSPERDYQLATTYLDSVETLIKHIPMNSSEGYNSSNIQLQVCQNNSVCNRTVLNVDVSVSSSAETVKTLGINGVSPYLSRNKYPESSCINMTVVGLASNNEPVNITMSFPTTANETYGKTQLCVFRNMTIDEWSETGCKKTVISENQTICDCCHLTSFSMLLSKTPVNLPFLDQLTYIGLGISICSLIVFLIIEFLVWSAVVKSNLSHFRHMSLVNIAVCLLIADCAFIASSFPNILNDALCLILTIMKHFFFLGMFFWMLSLSMMLLHQLIFVFNPLRKSVYMPLAIIVGYFFPTVVVGTTYLYYNKRKDVTYYNRATCWLTYVSSMQGSLYAFLLPMGFIIFANICSMVVVISTLLKPAATENTKKDDKEAAKSVIKVIVFLTPVFGGTWILGLMLFLIDDDKKVLKVIINYAFTIVNSLQGLFILLTGCFGEKRVRDEIVKIVTSSLGSKSETSKSSK